MYANIHMRRGENSSMKIVLRDVLRSVRTGSEYEEKSNKTLQ